MDDLDRRLIEIEQCFAVKLMWRPQGVGSLPTIVWLGLSSRWALQDHDVNASALLRN